MLATHIPFEQSFSDFQRRQKSIEIYAEPTLRKAGGDKLFDCKSLLKKKKTV